jgi:hypothetical protein
MMVDYPGKVHTLVVPATATAQQVADIWRRLLEFPDDVGLQVDAADETHFYWTYDTTKPTATCTFCAQNMMGNVEVLKGTPTFEADQISRYLDFKVPPLSKCVCELRPRAGPKVIFDGEVVPLGRKVVRIHLLSWNLEGVIIHAPQPTTWWLPYDHNEIMRYGNSLNTSIPADQDMAEFPPEP